MYTYIPSLLDAPPTPPLEVITEHWAELPALHCSEFYTRCCIYVNPSLPIHPTLPFPADVYSSSPCLELLPALELGSSVPFLWIPHTCINIRYLFSLSGVALYYRLWGPSEWWSSHVADPREFLNYSFSGASHELLIQNIMGRTWCYGLHCVCSPVPPQKTYVEAITFRMWPFWKQGLYRGN